MTFVNLTGYDFEPGVAECDPDCLILVNIHLLTLRSAEENQFSFLNASLTYHPAVANVVYTFVTNKPVQCLCITGFSGSSCGACN